MELISLVLGGFRDVFNVGSMLALTFGVSGGILVGALPGLSATMSVAVLTPLTFRMPPSIGITMLLGVYVGAIYGGSITAVLLRTPGTPSSICTTFDGYPLTQQGRASEALFLSLIASVVGGLISSVILILLAPQVARVALQFGPEEIFALTLFGLSIIVSVSGDSLRKGLLTGMFGVLLSIVGMDLFTAVPRFTFGSITAMQGLRVIPVLIGVFAISEVLNLVWTNRGSLTAGSQEGIKTSNWPLHVLNRQTFNLIRSSLIGTLVGIVPGTGGGIASFMAYDIAKRSSKTPDEFGKGSLEGIAAAESANNATTGGALVPMLTLGIPGEATTAVLISAFMIQGLQPGPLLFRSNPQVVYMLLAAMFVANIVLLVLGWLGMRAFAQVSRIPVWVLAPTITVLCVIGAYSVANSSFDVVLLSVLGLIGYLIYRKGYPGAPLIIGLILGPMNEKALRRALTASRGDWTVFVRSPISAFFIALALASVILAIVRNVRKQRTQLS